jgi:glycosyltransferase involved in cell wall biosynthesis
VEDRRLNRLKVVHCHNIAGVATTLAEFQRRLGVDASVIVRRRHAFGFDEKRCGRLEGLLATARADVVHYHWTSWLQRLPVFGVRNPDARLLGSLGKPIVAHFHGDDLRKNLARIRFKPDHTFVSTPDLLVYAPDAEWLPNPIDCETFTPLKSGAPATIRVGYYDPPGAGVYVPTEMITRAIAEVRKAGWKVEAAPAINVPRAQMLEYYRSLTIWIDKLDGGFYGIMACEAAASGLPVIASTKKISQYVSERVFYEFSGNLVEDLKYLLENEQERSKIAQSARAYVQNHHNPTLVANRTLEVYKSIT